MSAINSIYTTKDGKIHTIPLLWDETRQRCSAWNSKTGIVSVSFLAGAGIYDGKTPECLKGVLEPINGTCNCNCDGCYAKDMTRIPEIFIKFYLNTLEMRENPARFLALVEKELFGGHPLTWPRVVRFHDSGDIDNPDYLADMLSFIERHPAVTVGTYTKRDDIVTPEIIDALPENLTLSCSPWKDIAGPIGDLPQFIWDDGSDPEIAKLPHCPAVKKDGTRTGVKCCQCLHCYTAKRGDRWAVYDHSPAKKGRKKGDKKAAKKAA